MTEQPRKQEGVRALTRGLAILRHVNAAGGSARASEIAKALAIPRPTVYRLLETLEEAGYVAFSASANLVRVTRLAASLGDGYAVTSTLCQVAAPLMAEVGARIVWPLDLTIYDNAAMVIQETTHGRSPLSIDRAMIGYRLPVLRSSAGRAYLAFCPEQERLLILDHLRRLGEPADLPFLNADALQCILDDTRVRGLAIRDGGEFRERTSSIAVPILADAGVIGCVSLIWIRSAMETPAALAQYDAELLGMARRIAQKVLG
ncbi:DNA-binding transcriptional regulator [Candidimonas nitroreducens]|uniref:Transcriptional regulator n=1 Tax=Candidimonas nitroreducens TaxID=683354 RepID=A0A225MBM4_9BURK|nr:DNA-binding transcriptional regulator [Candidimonas nitroreducens]OWT57540.1 transcriptional regulator [Candidimonas nitroreducens]